MNKKGFTLIEVLIWILISSMIIVIWFQALSAVMIWKVKLIESTNIEKESFVFMQKFFEEIKRWWLIDYEEYFNRKLVWNTTYQSWHFLEHTWFWNFWTNGTVLSWSYWNSFYRCKSNSSSVYMDWNGCYLTWALNTEGGVANNRTQRYGQYSLQFIDYNSNRDWDWWNEDLVWWIHWDDDDEDLWIWPEVFQNWDPVTELYLISANKKTRTFFRWTVDQDKYINSSVASCSTTDFGKTFTWSWCLGTIEFLRLEWLDWWDDHDRGWNWLYDWVVDTWLINKDFAWINDYTLADSIVAWSNSENYWLPLFPDSINVKSFDIRAYPNKDIKNSWKESDIDISPYVRVNITLTPSRKVKKLIKWKVPEFNLSTTINLTDIFSR